MPRPINNEPKPRERIRVTRHPMGKRWETIPPGVYTVQEIALLLDMRRESVTERFKATARLPLPENFRRKNVGRGLYVIIRES